VNFLPFPKLARLNREIVVTEKIDGTNAQIVIWAADAEVTDVPLYPKLLPNGYRMAVGSRTRWITPADDNAGFAKWVEANAEELTQLGPGQHYGLTEKRFSLFNTGRWVDPKVLSNEDYLTWTGDQNFAPACCHVVPVLYKGLFSQAAIEFVLAELREKGSLAAPGFPNPEGIVIYHTAANEMFKVTLDNDGVPKSLVRAA
jgi:hypothetical protein